MSGRVGSITTDIITDGLVFNMDAANRASYPRSGTTATDTISSINGTINGASFETINNGVFDFDGNDDYIDCGTNLALLGSACTFSAWVKMTDATSFRILHKGIAGSREYAFGIGTSDTLFLVLYNGSTKYIGQVSTSTITSYQGSWIHICANYDGSTNASGIKLYVNGSVFGSSAATAGSYTAPSGNANGDVYIGRYNIEYADGNIANTQIYNRALSANEVLHNYNALKGRFGL